MNEKYINWKQKLIQKRQECQEQANLINDLLTQGNKLNEEEEKTTDWKSVYHFWEKHNFLSPIILLDEYEK